MKIVVTGGAGFIGSHIAEYLCKQHEVAVLDDLSTGRAENLNGFKDKIKMIKGSITSMETVNKALKGADVVLHQAAIPSVPRSIENPVQTSEVNIMGTLNILESARKNNVERVVLASSSSVYGESPELPKKETFCPMPKSPYAVSKLANELHAKNYFDLYGFKTISLRYFNVYGPRQDENSAYAAVIPKFIISMLNKKSPVIYGDGKQSRDFTFVSDVVNSNIKAIEAKKGFGEVYNIANGKSITLLELSDMLKKLAGFNGKLTFEPERKGDVKHSLADITKAKRLLGYNPTYTMEKGLKETVDWFRSRSR